MTEPQRTTPQLIEDIKALITEIQKLYCHDEIPWIIGYSGGKDSTAALLVPDVKDTFWVNLIGKGYPAPRNGFRWCTERLKIKLSIFLLYHNTKWRSHFVFLKPILGLISIHKSVVTLL
nr:hypothetical protein [Pseudanabaena sp. SR411]